MKILLNALVLLLTSMYLYRQIEIDSKFLEQQHIMDYSLLLGVHYRAPQHLRSPNSCSGCTATEGLGIVADDGRFVSERL